MTTAGPNSTGTVTSTQVDAGFETVDWSDPGNATASDDSYATATLAVFDQSYALRCTNFGFTSGDVPSGATINGILVEVEVSQDGGATQVGSPLVYSGSQIDPFSHLGVSAGNFDFTPDGTDTYWRLGGPTDTGGVSVTQAMVVNSSFGIDLYFGVDGFSVGSTVSVDHVRMTVYYTVGGPTTIAVSAAGLTYQGRATAVDAKTVKPVVAAAMPYAGRAIAVNAKTAKAVVAGAMAYAGAAVTVNAGKRVPVVAAAMAYAGQATRIAQRIIAGVGQIFYFGQLVAAGGAVAGAVAAGAQRLRLGGGFR